MIYRVFIDVDCLYALPKSGKRRDDVICFCCDLANGLYLTFRRSLGSHFLVILMT